jgi:hypothetical protein
MPKHKWANEIKAWADGAEIERRRYGDKDWENCENPNWLNPYSHEFRIKPQPKEPQYLYAYKKSDNEVSWDVEFIEPHDLAEGYQYVGKTLLIAGE